MPYKTPPKFNNQDTSVTSTQIFYGVKAGALDVELISAEVVQFGQASSMSYLRQKDSLTYASYMVKDDKKEHHGFAPTVYAVQRYDDGTPFVTFAAPAETMIPKAKKIMDCSLDELSIDLKSEKDKNHDQDNDTLSM